MPRRRKEPPPLPHPHSQLLQQPLPQPTPPPQYHIPVHHSPPSTRHVFTSGPIPVTQQPHQQHQPQPHPNRIHQEDASIPSYSPTGGLLGAPSPEPLRLLAVLDSLKSLGFTSISDFLVRLFNSDDAAVRRRVSLFYTHGGIRSVLEIFMNSKRARENGGDEVAVSWAGGVFKDEFDAGLVKGGVRIIPPLTC